MERRQQPRMFSPWFAAALGAALLLCLVILVRDILPTRRTLRELRKRERALVLENRRLETEVRRLELFEDALANDAQTVERELRRKVHVARPGEKLIRYEENED